MSLGSGLTGGRARSNSAPAIVTRVPDRPVGLAPWVARAIERSNFSGAQRTRLATGVATTNGAIPSIVAAAAQFDVEKRRSLVDAAIRKFIDGLKFSDRAPYLLFLVGIIRELDRLSPTPLPTIDLAIRNALPPSIDRLNEMVRYASLNVLQFAAVPPTGVLNLIKNRYYAAINDPATAESAGKTVSLVDKNLTRIQMETMAKGVFETRSGVCTSFAAAAASLLDKDRNVGRDRDYRVEYIGSKDHNICLIDRDDTFDEIGADWPADKMPDPNEWSEGTIIVDPWGGAMGHGCVFYKWPGRNLRNHDYPGVLRNSFRGKPIKKYFDSSKG